MAFITAPDFKIAAINWVFRRPAQVNVSGWTGRRTVVANPWHGKWLANVQLAPMKTEDMRLIRSFFARCKGTINTFRLYASEGPQNNNGAVTTTGGAAGAVSLVISGADVALTEGQFVTVNGQLLLLTANQSGSTITFEPPLRATVANATTVVTQRPYTLVSLVNSDVSWAAEPGVFYNVSFDVEEAILETDGAAPETTAAPFNTALPNVTGTQTQGATLSVSNGSWANGVSSYAYQWLRNGNPISGATGATYVLTLDAVGQIISARVTATNATGSVAAVSNSTGAIASSASVAPSLTAAPVITGTPTQGQTLTVSDGTWTGSPSFARQWLRDGVAIGGATATTYLLAAADANALIRARVTATNAGGSSSATADQVGPIAALVAPVNLTLPIVSGALHVGGTLSTTNGTWSGSPSSYTYRWNRNGVAIPEANATLSTYVLTAADANANISVAVTAVNATGSTAATSASTSLIDEYSLFLSFKSAVYRLAGTAYAALASVPGYIYTRSGAKGELTANITPTPGPELVNNGTFTTSTAGWSPTGASITVDTARLKVTATAGTNYTTQIVLVEVGKVYRFTGTLALGNTADKARFEITGAYGGVHAIAVGANVDFTFIAATTALSITCQVANASTWGAINDYAFFDNISVKEQAPATYGSELVINGDFNSNVANWTPVNANSIAAFDAGRLKVTTTLNAGNAVYQLMPVTIGKTYRVKATIALGNTIDKGRISLTDAHSVIHTYITHGPNVDIVFAAAASTLQIHCEVADGGAWGAINDYAFFDNISVTEVVSSPVQYFAANQPGVVPNVGYYSRTALTNFLAQSQHFDTTSSWIEELAATTVNQAIAPNGTLTADKLASAGVSPNVYQYTLGVTVAPHTMSVFAKRGDYDFVQLSYDETITATFNLSTGTVAHTASSTGYIVACGNGWFRVVMTFTTNVINSYVRIRLMNGATGVHAPVDKYIYIWQGQLIAGTYPDGGPIIETAATTVAVGEDLLVVNNPLMTDQDFIVYATMNYGVHLGEWRMALADISGAFYFGSSPSGYYYGMQNATSVTVPVGRSVILLRRRAGKWTLAWKKPDLTIGMTGEVTAAYPSMGSGLYIGAYTTALYHAKNPEEAVGIKFGTFSNTEIITLLGAL